MREIRKRFENSIITSASNIKLEHSIRTFNSNIQFEHAIRTCNSNMQFEHAIRTCNSNMQFEHAIRTCNSNMQFEHSIQAHPNMVPRVIRATSGMFGSRMTGKRGVRSRGCTCSYVWLTRKMQRKTSLLAWAS